MAGKKSKGVLLGSVITDISRGVQLTAAELEACLTDRETGWRYLSLADISGGSLQLNTQQLRSFDPEALGRDVGRYCLKENMILLTKNDTPFKVEIVGEIGEEKIVASGNIYMITADESKVIPRWLCYWLQGDEGMGRLRSAAASTNNGRMKWLSIKQIKGIVVPELTFQQQADLLIGKLNEFTRWLVGVTEELRRSKQEIFEILKTLGVDVSNDDGTGE